MNAAHQSVQLTTGSRFIIDESTQGQERHFPFIYKFGNDLFIPISEHEDAILPSPFDGIMISHDNGATWTKKTDLINFYFTSMYEYDGRIYAITYFTYPIDKDTEKMIYWTTDDRGDTWEKHEGIVKAPKGKQFGAMDCWGSLLFHRGHVVTVSGTVITPMYGYYEGEDKYTTVLAVTSDCCKTWNILSTIASGIPQGIPATADGFCEPTICQVRDSSLLVVMRVNSFCPLYQSRSLDGGLSWSEAQPLPGIKSEVYGSVDPKLLLMENGILALSLGRPGASILFSRDGCGYRWDMGQVIYGGITTGYTDIIETQPGSLLYISDQGNLPDGIKHPAIWGQFLKVSIEADPN